VIDNVIRAASSIRHHRFQLVKCLDVTRKSALPQLSFFVCSALDMSLDSMPEAFVLERGDAVSPSSRLSSFAVYTPSYARADGSVSITHATEPLARVSEFHF
jgi:hypothetical protein